MCPPGKSLAAISGVLVSSNAKPGTEPVEMMPSRRNRQDSQSGGALHALAWLRPLEEAQRT